jgi:hypothetical protein
MKRKFVQFGSKKLPDDYPRRLAKWMKDQFACFSARRDWTRAVHIKLEAVLHEKAIVYSTATKYLRTASFGERYVVQGDSVDAPMWILSIKQFSKR